MEPRGKDCDCPLCLYFREVGRPYSKTIKRKLHLLAHNGGFCAYCGTPLTVENSTLDHVKPKSKGGSDALENLVICCTPCNQIKGNRSLDGIKKEIDRLQKIENVLSELAQKSKE